MVYELDHLSRWLPGLRWQLIAAGAKREDAEDAVSIAILKALKHPEAVGYAWLAQVARREHVSILRARARDRTASARAAGRAQDEPDIAERISDRAAAVTAVDRLAAMPEQSRRVAACLDQGLSLAETARELDITNRAAESHRDRLRVASRMGLTSSSAGVLFATPVTRRRGPAAKPIAPERPP